MNYGLLDDIISGMEPGDNIKIKKWNNIQKKDRKTGDIFKIESPFHQRRRSG